MKFKILVSIVSSALLMSACAVTEVTQTSANTAVINTSAAPACGANGAAHVAAAMAAVTTIRQGFDKYVINGGGAQNNVHTYQGAGYTTSSGTVNYGSGFGTYYGTSTYHPGPVMELGSHDQSFDVTMFHNGDPGSENAIDARMVLGPKWEDKVKNGIHTCTN